MRVTQSMLSNNFLNNMGKSYEKMGKITEQMYTQKKITRPSDDPVVAMKGVFYRTNLKEVEQFKRNFTEAHNWIDNTDAALDQATKVMQRIRDLTLQAANGTLDGAERNAVGKEVEQLRDQLAEIGNTKVGDKFLFNGTDTTNAPVVDVTTIPADVSQNTNPVKLELSKGSYIQVNTENPLTSDIFDQLNQLIDKLDPNNTNPNFDSDLGNLDAGINKILNARSTLGARSNRIELMEDRIDQQGINATSMMSKNEDADMEKVITDLVTQEAVQRASLGMGARIIQPTLLDFLR
ncbi:flagellar hook-associated protein FlgL [Heyndrickxia sp. FSL K6-6286]|uniref:flagellar hook-associated protein FlgL n=1 Tax=Heyndrickxia sp. FSL K6-6286 TaxID=2921510 RepID=UPI00315AA7A9